MTSPLTHVLEVPPMPVVGAVRSILTAGVLVALVERPAPLLTVLVLVNAAPSPVILVFAGAVGMPDSGSAAVQPMVTSPEYQPAAFGEAMGAPERVGAVVSPAATTLVADAVLLAKSAAVPTTVVPGWTVLEFVVDPLARQLAIPDVKSAQVKVTVVVPSAFLTWEAPIVGAFLSIRTVTEPVPTLPSRSDPVEVRVTVPFPLSVEDAGVGALVTPDALSVEVQATAVLVLFQPAVLGAGVSAAVTTGPVLSRTYDA